MQKKLIIISLILFSFVFVQCSKTDKKGELKSQTKIEKLLSK